MTIFETNPMEIKHLIKTPFYNNMSVSQWNIELCSSRNGYKSDEGRSRSKKTKKRVSFADEKGQCLVKIITIERSDGSKPRLDSLLTIENSRITSKSDISPVAVIAPHDWVTSFIQPASIYGRFKSELLKQNVKLANAVIVKNPKSESEYEYQITGVIKVVNLCFEKRVFVRLSTDCQWTSSRDYDAQYKSTSSDVITESNETCCTDDFEFHIELPTSFANIPTHLEFAVGMETPQGQFWDSNCDRNYRLDYCQVSSAPSTKPSSDSCQSPGPYTIDYKPNLGQFRNEYTKYRAWNHFSDEMSFY